jgi:tetratricopeptide (TPR) repeat protein
VFLNPYYWANQNALGRTYFQSGNYLKALEEFQQVIALQPDNDAGYENVGGAYLRQGQYQEAVPYFQKALRIKPHYSTYSNLGTSYFFLKQYLNAVEQFEKAVAMDRADTTLMANMADSYRELGRPERARAAYQRAIQLGTEELKTNPQNSDVMAQIALCYANLGDAQQADGFIKKARAIDKSNVNYIYEEAEIYALLGKSKEALNALRESLDKHYPAQFAAEDSALNSIRNNPEYRQLIYKYSEKPAVPQVAAH